MKISLQIADEFGAHLADGVLASQFRSAQIDPYVSVADEVIFDFNGVRNSNSSFMNSLIAGLVAEHGEAILNKLDFKGCNRLIQVLIESAIALGLQKHNELSHR